jgi:hypothetical protein
MRVSSLPWRGLPSMLRFKCPKCATALTADAAAGRVVIPCPKCGLLVRLKAPAPKPPANPPPAPAPPPAARPPEDPASVFNFADPSQEAPVVVQPIPAARKPDDEEADAAPGPRRRRKRRRKSASVAFSFGDGIYLGVTGLLAALGISFVIIVWFNHNALLGLITYSIVLTLVGVVWLYVMAMEDGMELVPRPDFGPGARFLFGIWFSVAVLIMFVTAVIYLATNPARAWKPGIVAVLGFLLIGVTTFIALHPPR